MTLLLDDKCHFVTFRHDTTVSSCFVCSMVHMHHSFKVRFHWAIFFFNWPVVMNMGFNFLSHRMLS